MTKHTYTNSDAPKNTGSRTRPARFDLRLDCSTRARTLKVFSETREMLGMPKGYTYADVWQYGLLPAMEHCLWHLRESPSAMKTLVRSLYDTLPKEDWVRARYAALKERLEPKPAAPKAKQADLFQDDFDDDD